MAKCNKITAIRVFGIGSMLTVNAVIVLILKMAFVG